MEKQIESLGKFLPTATVSFFLAVISLNAGVFRYVGYEWMSALQLPDILSISWPILPFIAILVAIQLTVLKFDEDKAPEKVTALADNHPKIAGWVSILHSIFISAGPIVLAVAFMLIPPSYSGSWIFISLLMMLLYLIGTLAQVLTKRSFSSANRAQWLFATASVALILFSFSIGATYGGFIYSKPYNDSIEVEGGVIEKINIMVVLKSGVLARSSGHNVVFFPENKITKISLNVDCEMQRVCNIPYFSFSNGSNK